jgi:hypothetical protein
MVRVELWSARKWLNAMDDHRLESYPDVFAVIVIVICTSYCVESY